MPNPLLSLAKNTSKRAQVRPVPIPPVIERYEGDNNAYRGTEPHGVTPTFRPHDPNVEYDNAGDVIVEYEIEAPEAEPIAVRIVTGQDAETRYEMRTYKSILPLDGTPVRIVGAMRGRKSVIIKNVTLAASNAAFIGNEPSAVGTGGMNAWILSNGEMLTLVTEGDVWASVAKGAPLDVVDATIDVRLNVIMEYPVRA